MNCSFLNVISQCDVNTLFGKCLLTGSDQVKLKNKTSNQTGGCITFSSAIVRGDLLHQTAIGKQKYSSNLNELGGGRFPIWWVIFP